MIDRLTERQQAAQAFNTAADLMRTTAALIEQGEGVEAECRLRALRRALNAADPDRYLLGRAPAPATPSRPRTQPPPGQVSPPLSG